MAKLVFNPMLDLIAERERATVGAQETARDATEEAARLEAQYEAALTDARVEGMRKKFAIIDAARKDADAIIASSENDANEQLAQARAEITSTVERARQAAESEMSQLADEIVRRVVEPSERTH